MANRRIHGDDQVEGLEGGGRFGKHRGLGIEFLADVLEVHVFWEFGHLLAPVKDLEPIEVDAGDAEEGLELPEIDGAEAVGGKLGVSLPADAYIKPVIA